MLNLNIFIRFEITDGDGNVALVILGPWCTLACGSDVEFKANYVHLDVEDCSEKLLRQQSYAKRNQLGYPKPPAPRWFFMA